MVAGLGWEDKGDGVGCWQAHLTSRCMAGDGNKCGMINCDSHEVQAAPSGLHGTPCTGGPLGFWVTVQGGMCVRGWDMSRECSLNIDPFPLGHLQELNTTTTSSGDSGNSGLKVNRQKCPGQGPSQVGTEGMEFAWEEAVG